MGTTPKKGRMIKKLTKTMNNIMFILGIIFLEGVQRVSKSKRALKGSGRYNVKFDKSWLFRFYNM